MIITAVTGEHMPETKIISHRTVEVTLTVEDLMQLAGLDSDSENRQCGCWPCGSRDEPIGS